MTKPIYNDKFYKDVSNSSYNSAKIFLKYLWQYIQPVSVLDVGCGKGAWLKACHEYGSKNLMGFDGGWINKTSCQLHNTSLSIWYLKRLNSIQFDEKGIPQIKKVLKEYKREVNPI